MPKLKINISFSTILKYISPAVLIIMTVILGMSLIFIYQKVWQTLSVVRVITELRQRVAEEELQMKKFEEIQSLIEAKDKKSTINYSLIKDNFQPLK